MYSKGAFCCKSNRRIAPTQDYARNLLEISKGIGVFSVALSIDNKLKLVTRKILEKKSIDDVV
ncbi:hypothetical protein KL86SPO_70604 [uncultured Sporomusa sp.]|uniref:Uncharacterized protein n=1 Tax=uncultured Sporomusa sp. TaxID=307249 RepID=A0A212M1W1_9FIRM|nr:hypothetical protein KL86SPO_70604 [uncultured Sporomusa sp.]